MISDKTRTEIPVKIPEGEIDWLEMCEWPKEFTHTRAPRISYADMKVIKRYSQKEREN